MKNLPILSILLVALTLMMFACQPDDPPGPVNEFRLDENQQNWKKRLLIQRPVSDIPGSLPGEYAETGIRVLYSGGDTVTAMVNLIRTQPYTMLFMSFNGGSTWSTQGSHNGIITDSEQRGILVYAMRSYNGGSYLGRGYQYGTSWSWQALSGQAEKLTVLNDDTLVAYGEDGIRVSENAGTNWTLISNESPSKLIRIDHQTLLGVFENEIRSSQNNGLNWSVKYTSAHVLKTLSLHPNGDVFAGGASGCILKSSDSGQTWSQVFILTQIYSQAGTANTFDVHFIDSLHGFAAMATNSVIDCGDTFDALTGCIVRTQDGGETWSVNYRSEFIRYAQLLSANGPTMLAGGYQLRDNYISGSYVTITQTLGN